MNWMIQSMLAASAGLRPIHSPSGTPVTAASPKPARQRPSVAAAFCHSVVSR